MTLALRLLRLPTLANTSAVGTLLRQQYSNLPVVAVRLYASSHPQPKKIAKADGLPPPPPKVPESNKNPPPDCPAPPANPTQSTPQCAKNVSPAAGVSVPPAKSKLSRDVMRRNVQGYMFTRFFDYVKNYDKLLEKNFPSAVRVYRVFVDGVTDFFGDMKRFLQISRIVRDSPQGLKALNRKELELYMRMPRDMVKVAPALIGSSLPVVGYAVLPLVFMFPHRWLTSHFWTIQQRVKFQQIEMQRRLQNNRPVFRLLQAKLSCKNLTRNPQLEQALGLVGSGFHPNVTSLLDVKDVFAQKPYNFCSLSGKHVKLLNAMHGIPSGWFARRRLYEHAFLVRNMDLAITREGGVHNMPVDALRYSCFVRGLNPSNLSNEEMIEWLRDWITVSTAIQKEHISLFLHLPIFLAYNHPNNWQLIYDHSRPQQ